MEEVEERNEAHGCHEDQEFLFVIIVPIGSSFDLIITDLDLYRYCVEE